VILRGERVNHKRVARVMWSAGFNPITNCFDVVEGSGRIYVQSMVGGSGRRLSSAAMIRCWSPWSAGIGMLRERAGVPCRRHGTDAAGGKSESREWRSGMTRPVPQGLS
jgi:hypothetical protein